MLALGQREVACPRAVTANVEPYDTVLCALSLLEHSDVALMMDAEALAAELWISNVQRTPI